MRSLVGELVSHLLCSVAKKTQTKQATSKPQQLKTTELGFSLLGDGPWAGAWSVLAAQRPGLLTSLSRVVLSRARRRDSESHSGDGALSREVMRGVLTAQGPHPPRGQEVILLSRRREQEILAEPRPSVIAIVSCSSRPRSGKVKQ